MERSRPDTTPAVIESASPSGLPTENVSSPTFTPPPSTAGTITLGGCSGCRIAVSRSGVDVVTSAALLVPSLHVTSIDVEPSGHDARMSTSDGWVVRYTTAATAGAAVVVVGPGVAGAARSESDERSPSTSA